MDFDPFGSLTDEKDAEILTSNWNLLSNEEERSEEKLMIRTEEDAEPDNDNTFSTDTAEGVDVDNRLMTVSF